MPLLEIRKRFAANKNVTTLKEYRVPAIRNKRNVAAMKDVDIYDKLKEYMLLPLSCLNTCSSFITCIFNSWTISTTRRWLIPSPLFTSKK